jgi:hypothetical protein
MRPHPSSSYFFQSFPTLEHFDIVFSEGAFWIYLVGWNGFCLHWQAGDRHNFILLFYLSTDPSDLPFWKATQKKTGPKEL